VGAFATVSLCVVAAGQNTGSHRRLNPGEIDALEQTGPSAGTSGFSGIQTRVLKGDPTRSGLYTIQLKVTANTGRVALRWPKSAIVEKLIEEFDGPVTGTSANISGFASCASAAQVMKQLGTRLPLILDGGESGATLASTIVELNGDSWKIGREGAISVAEIEKALK